MGWFYGSKAFYFSSVESVEFPDTLESIGTESFAYTHLSGEELSDSYAVYIVLPYDELDRYSLLISNLVEGYVDISNHQIPFIGIGHSKNVNSPVILSSWDISKYVYSKTYKTFVSAKMVNTLTNEVFDIKRSYQNVGVPTVYMPKKYMDIEKFA